jgi:hypothetical protein
MNLWSEGGVVLHHLDHHTRNSPPALPEVPLYALNEKVKVHDNSPLHILTENQIAKIVPKIMDEK